MRKIMIAAGLAAALSGCATGPTRFPVQATRYHFDAMTDRGTIAVEPLTGSGTASIEYKTYAAAVQSQLLRQGFTNPAPGATAEYIATVGFTRAPQSLPRRRSPISIGLGGGTIVPLELRATTGELRTVDHEGRLHRTIR